MSENDGSRVLDGHVALVTGATSGIGLATAVELCRRGATLACLRRASSNTAALDAALADADGAYTSVTADLADMDEVQAVIPTVLGELGRIDILINSGGIADTTSFLDQSLESFDTLLDIDLRAPFILSQAAGRAMVDAGRGGRIVNLSSSSAFRAEFVGPAYAAAKGGLNAMTRAAAWALGPHGITVNAVVPGLTATPMATMNFPDRHALEAAVSEEGGPLRNLLRRVTEADDVAAVIAFLCLPAARQVTGQMIHVSAGAVV